MPMALLKYGLRRSYRPEPFLPPQPDLKPAYDVVVIGGGGHGLAIAYHLARDHGIRDVAVIEKGYIGGGNTARNTAIVRANYLTPDGVAFYKESMDLWRGLPAELDINLMYSERGHLTLAHTDATVKTMRRRAEVNKHLGVDSELIGLDELARLCPVLDLSRSARFPVLGALYHRPGATARHDAVAWGYARAASRLGVEIHQGTEAIGMVREGNRVVAVDTPRGRIAAGGVVQAVAGASIQVAAMAGLALPIHPVPLQACVSVPMKPVFDPIVVSGSLHLYIWQSQRGEMVMGGSVDPYPLHATRSTLDFKEGLMMHIVELFPFLAEARLMRQWAGVADVTADFSPIMGTTPLDNYYVDAGWGTWGFKATPVSGKRMAECAATGRQPALIEPFRLDRFTTLRLVAERGAASVGT